MNSKQKNTNDDSKKQPASSTAMKIYDEGIDSNKKHEHHRRPNRTNVLANANNKFEEHQKEDQVPQHSWKNKKKLRGPRQQQKKKHWNNNRKTNGIVDGTHHNWAMNNSDHSRNSGFNENYHHHMRNNNQDHLAYEQGKVSANHDSTGSQPFFSRYIPGNQHTFPIPHPQHSNRQQQQQQQHLFADDGNAKILLERQGNRNGVLAGDSQFIDNHSNGNVNGAQWNINMDNSTSCTSCMWWVGMIDRNTKVDAVVISTGGNIHHVPLPPKVGDCLKQELLIQKENFINGNNIDRIGSEASDSLQGGNPQANTSTQGFGEHGNAPVAYPMATNLGNPQSFAHPYTNAYPEGQVLYGIPVNTQQSFNGGVPFPPPDNNGTMRMAAPASYYPMMPQQVQYATMYPPQYPAMTSVANIHQQNAGNTSGYGPSNGLHANGDYSSEGMNGENRANAQGRAIDHQQADNERRNVEALPNGGGANEDTVAEGGNNAPNQVVATPHRGAPRPNGGRDARRVSFSPKVPSFETLAIVNNDNN